MTTYRSLSVLLLAAAIACVSAPDASAQNHVLLISVDGLHALDVARYVQANPKSALAELSRHGITYSNARTPSLSDSFPGLLALVTGGSPVSHGLFYDVSYDRTIFDPTNTTCASTPGNAMVFGESIDLYLESVYQTEDAQDSRGNLPGRSHDAGVSRNRSSEAAICSYREDGIAAGVMQLVPENKGRLLAGGLCCAKQG